MRGQVPTPYALFIVPVAMVLLALLDMPYGYYTLLRIVITGCAAWLSFANFRLDREWLGMSFALLAAAYNPLFPPSFDREAWAGINIGTAGVFFIGLAFAWNDNREARAFSAKYRAE